MHDSLAVAITNNAAMRIYAAVTTGLAAEAQRIHHTYPVATAALGRVLTAGTMMGAMLKEDDASVTIQFKGDGPLGTILAVADAKSCIRGYVSNPDVELASRADGKLDVGRGVGKNGYLSVVRSAGDGIPYTGQVELVSGEIAEDLTAYYAISEQIPTAVALGVLVNTDGSVRAAGGYMLQMMPGYDPDDERLISLVERQMKELPPVSALVEQGYTPTQMIERLLGGEPYNILKSLTPAYRCRCSKQRVEAALVSIGRKELQALCDEQAGTEVNCSFCDQTYRFSKADLEQLILKCKK